MAEKIVKLLKPLSDGYDHLKPGVVIDPEEDVADFLIDNGFANLGRQQSHQKTGVQTGEAQMVIQNQATKRLTINGSGNSCADTLIMSKMRKFIPICSAISTQTKQKYYDWSPNTEWINCFLRILITIPVELLLRA